MESSVVALLQRLFALGIYPGLLLLLVLVIVVGRLVGGRTTGGRALYGFSRALRGEASPAYAVAALLVLLGLSRLPWPNPHWRPRAVVDVWLLWGLIEGSTLAATLPGLLVAEPIANRAAVRGAQLGLSGRLVIWIAVAAAAGAGANREVTLLALLAAFLALPAAALWPPLHFDPFAAGRLGSAHSQDDAALAGWTQRLWSIFWLSLIATVFIPLPSLAWYGELVMRLATVVGLGLVWRGLEGRFVNVTLPAALRWCWLLALPFALGSLAVLYIRSSG